MQMSGYVAQASGVDSFNTKQDAELVTLLTHRDDTVKQSMECVRVCVCKLKSLVGVTFSSSAFETQNGTNKGQPDKVQGSMLA